MEAQNKIKLKQSVNLKNTNVAEKTENIYTFNSMHKIYGRIKVSRKFYGKPI